MRGVRGDPDRYRRSVSEIPTSQADEVGSPHSVLSIVLRLLAAVAVAALAILVQRTVLADDPSRSTFGVKVRSYPIESELLERTMSSRVVVPPGAAPKDRPLVVFLHGRGEDERSYLIEPMFEALSDLRSRAPVIVFPSGGDSSYWHDRESGAWGSYVLDEVIPDVVERFDIDPDQIAIGGISMGGFGAFDIARLEPERFCATAGHSPVIWETTSETADGAFDNAEDFERNDVITVAGSEPNPYDGMRVWLDAGDDDPFLAGDQAFEQALRTSGVSPIVSRSAGGHDSDYWNDNWEEYLGFYARALAACANEQGEGEKGEKKDGGGDQERNGVNGSRRPSSDAAPAGAG